MNQPSRPLSRPLSRALGLLRTVALATGILGVPPALAATALPASLDFGGQSMNTTSPAQTVTFTNNGGTVVTVSGVTTSNPQFIATHNCTVALAPSATCQVTVRFKPAAGNGIINSITNVTGTLSIASNAAGSPNTVALAGTGEKSLITHFYRTILRRAPDAGGKAFWANEGVRMVNLGANVNETWYGMAQTFYFSAEYAALNRTNDGFVTDLYNTFFDRAPDAPGLAFWVGNLAQGMPREVVLVSFLFSAEFRTLTQGVFGTSSTRAEIDVVGDFYRGVLLRLGDDGGFNSWVSAFQAAQCQGGPGPVVTQIENISNAFVTSPEYAAKNRTDAQFVGDMYNAFLRRGGDLGGVQFWIAEVASGRRTRGQVRQAFVASPEFQARVNAIIAQGCRGNLRFISPTGSDGNDGRAQNRPWKTFAKAFSTMASGDELVLLDGTYGVQQGTGYISYVGTGSGQPPSGTSLNAMTVVRALNPGNVTVKGGLFIGRSTRKDRFIKIQGITFEATDASGGGNLYNTDSVTLKDCGFSGSLNVGTNDHDQYNDNNLIEDVWVWARGERIIAINYRSHNNVWRRVVVRGDGCGTMDCTGSGNPNVGITVYDSSNISLQNVLVVDRGLEPTDEPYSDFAIAQHTPDPQFYFGRNEWLGTMSINGADTGYQMEPDAGQTLDPTIKIQNAVVWDSRDGGFNLGRAGTNNLIENVTVFTRSGDGIRVAPELTTGIVRNAIVLGQGRYGINSKYKPSHVNLFFTAATAQYNQTTCSTVCITTNPKTDTPGPSLLYMTRIEAGSKLKGAGEGGRDIGANILFRYGADGARFGQANYNTLTTTPLWPWPNEARMKREMCTSTTRGFCATGTRMDGVNPVTLTSYIWEFLGNPIPPGIY